MKRIILCLSLFAFFGSQAQQINPVPDYVFSNKMSVGRNAVTDTAAYFSIGPRYGAIRGMMPPMVTDTANMSATKRNGLLIFSIQKNKYLYWDSVGSKWAEMAGTAGSAITGSGVAGYMPEFTTTTNLDTTRLYHSAGRFAIGSTTTTNGVFNVIGGTTYLEGNLSFGAADRTISNISNNVLAFGTNNTERMRIGANGDMAIGTTNADPFARGDDRRIAMDATGISSTANIALSLNAGASAGRGAQIYLGVGGTRHFEFSSNANEQAISAISNTNIRFQTNNTERMRLKADGELLLNTTSDAGAYQLQVAGAIYNTTTITTGAPTSGSAKPWRLGEAATVSPTSPNRTIRVEIDGTVYYIHAKTTND